MAIPKPAGTRANVQHSIVSLCTLCGVGAVLPKQIRKVRNDRYLWRHGHPRRPPRAVPRLLRTREQHRRDSKLATELRRPATTALLLPERPTIAHRTTTATRSTAVRPTSSPSRNPSPASSSGPPPSTTPTPAVRS